MENDQSQLAAVKSAKGAMSNAPGINIHEQENAKARDHHHPMVRAFKRFGSARHTISVTVSIAAKTRDGRTVTAGSLAAYLTV